MTMLAKITAKNQLTLPKSLTQAVGATEYFDVEARAGQLILTPVRIQRGDAVRAKLAELDLSPDDLVDAVEWARSGRSANVFTPAMAAEPGDTYQVEPKATKKTPKAKPSSTKTPTKSGAKKSKPTA
jgi:hypothetical protein